MKFFKRLFFIILVIFIFVVVGLFVFLKKFDVDSYKPQIVASLSRALNREVDFKDIDLELSLSQGLRLTVKDLKVSGENSFKDENLLIVKRIFFDLEIIPLISKRELLISSISIDGLDCTIVREKNGDLNLKDLGRSKPASKNSTGSKASLGLGLIFAREINLNNSSIIIVDKSVFPQRKITLSEISFEIDDFSLTKEFPFSIEASIFSYRKNIVIEGEASIDIKSKSLNLEDLEFETDLSLLVLEQIEELVGAGQSPFPDTLSGLVEVSVDDFNLGLEETSFSGFDFEISDGEVAFREIAKNIPFRVSQLDCKIDDFSLVDDFSFSLQAAYLSHLPNIDIDSTVSLNLDNKTIKFRNGRMANDLSSISLVELKDAMSSFNDFELPRQVGGKLSVDLNFLELGLNGVVALSANLDLRNGLIKHSALKTPIDSLYLNLEMTESKMHTQKFSFSLGEGEIALAAGLDDYINSKRFNFEFDILSLNLGESINQNNLPIKFDGVFSGKLKLGGEKFFENEFIDSLAGEGDFELNDGKLMDINVLELALSKISLFPNLVEKLKADLPEKYNEKLTRNETEIKIIKAKTFIADSRVNFGSLEVDAEDFIFKGSGYVNFDQEIFFDGIFFIPKDLASYIAENSSEMVYFLDEQGMIQAPLQVTGKAPKIKFKIDLGNIAQKALEKKAGEEIDRFLNKIFDREEKKQEIGDQEGVTSETEGVKQPVEKEKSLEEELIGSVLKSIFN